MHPLYFVLTSPSSFATQTGLGRVPLARYQRWDPKEFRDPNGPLPQLWGGRRVRGPGFREGGGGKAKAAWDSHVSATSAAAGRDLARITFPPPPPPIGCVPRAVGKKVRFSWGATRRSAWERARMRPTPAVVVRLRRPKAIFRFLEMGSYDPVESLWGFCHMTNSLLCMLKKK